MSLLLFEDDDLDMLFRAINNLQICFHHKYAPDGRFSVHSLFELQSDDKNVRIIADRNIVSPICEIATKGKLSDTHRMQKIALFVTWTKYIHAQLSSGLGLYESDTSGLSTVSGEENRLQFLHGVDTIPSQLWKWLAFGEIDEIPSQYLFKKGHIKNMKYDFSDNLLFLCNQAAVIKITQLIRTPELKGVDKFLTFMEWYAGHMDIAESIVLYAACVFMETPHVAKPKASKSKDFKRTIAGINNQAWDITYITAWSMQYRNEPECDVTMFATDDITQKVLTINILPPGECGSALRVIFDNNQDYNRIADFWNKKLGPSRVRPFSGRKNEENIEVIRQLVESELEILKMMFAK